MSKTVRSAKAMLIAQHYENGEQTGDEVATYRVDETHREELRDHFAAAALTGALANPHTTMGDVTSEVFAVYLASHCWKIADAMIAARDATPSPSATEGGDAV